ncbi:unnamed protein product [Polarella glacialis]|uniref:Pre-mRNA-splicing factor SLU7 n=1 Tax=Polarella glacialis TaxID=89957 RepID=A0A813JMT9_POLGL|nr:unnamed protein product [Polarella glacialis]
MECKAGRNQGTKGDVKTKFLKGACENCGATTHTKKDCVERPRLVSARQNGKNLMPDEYISDLKLDWDGKRDRWNGYQPEDYKKVIEEWESVEGERRRVKAAEMEERAKLKERMKAQKKALKKKRKQRRKQLRRQAGASCFACLFRQHYRTPARRGQRGAFDWQTACSEGVSLMPPRFAQAEGKESGTDTDVDSDTGDSDTDTDTDSDSEASDDEVAPSVNIWSSSTVAAKDDKLRTTTRNLRIREDTAKYLLNLVNSAYYDPKSRSMRDDPLRHLKELMCFAWDAYKHGGEKVHDTAQPTQALKMFKDHCRLPLALDMFTSHQQFSYSSSYRFAAGLVCQCVFFTHAAASLDEAQYGCAEHMDAPKELLFAQNDVYVEYARDGRVLKGRERALVKSKYEEDVLVGNHTSSWGTFFDTQSNRTELAGGGCVVCLFALGV